jgi:hypothetical protein
MHPPIKYYDQMENEMCESIVVVNKYRDNSKNNDYNNNKNHQNDVRVRQVSS